MKQTKLSTLKPLKAVPYLAVAFPVLLLAFFMSSEFLSNTSAERINVNIGDGAYYMNITADDLDIDIDATPAGVKRTVQKDIRVSTNSGTGYKLYLSMNNADTNGNRLYYNGNNTDTNFIKPTTTTSLSDNSWGYSTDGNNFSAVPLQGNETVIASAATSPATPVTHSVYYGFNVDNSLPFGSYSGVVTYTAVADAAASPTAHTSVANYLDDKSAADPAGGDTLVITTSLMTNMTNIGDVTVNVGGDSCPVTGVTTKDKYVQIECTMPAKSAGTYTVNATLAKFEKTYSTTATYYESGMSFGRGMKKIRTMQGMTTDVCRNIPTPAAFTTGTTFNTDVPRGRLSDTRDTNFYYVKKLADGNCWMDQNLNLDLGTADSSGTANTTWKLTSADTDINYNNYKGSTATADNEWIPPYNTQWNSSTSWSPTPAKSFTFKDDVYTGGAHSGGTTGRYWNNNTGTSTTIGNYTERNHFGNYYNVTAATAGSIAGTEVGKNTGDSICPKGWQLPTTDGGAKSFDNLIRTVYNISSTTSDAQVVAEPIHLIRSGWYYAGGGLDRQGTGMLYGGSTVTATMQTYGWYSDYNTSNSYSGFTSSGGAIRCVSR